MEAGLIGGNYDVLKVKRQPEPALPGAGLTEGKPTQALTTLPLATLANSKGTYPTPTPILKLQLKPGPVLPRAGLTEGKHPKQTSSLKPQPEPAVEAGLIGGNYDVLKVKRQPQPALLGAGLSEGKPTQALATLPLTYPTPTPILKPQLKPGPVLPRAGLSEGKHPIHSHTTVPITTEAEVQPPQQPSSIVTILTAMLPCNLKLKP